MIYWEIAKTVQCTGARQQRGPGGRMNTAARKVG
jgi:hypothetical protein